MLILHSSENKGVSFIETKNLDGETNLKHKCAPLEAVNLNERSYKDISIECE